MKSIFQLFLATLLVTLLATKVCNARDIPDREIRQDAKEPGEMTNALNYLAELDKYYSNAARPRYVFLLDLSWNLAGISMYQVYVTPLYSFKWICL